MKIKKKLTLISNALWLVFKTKRPFQLLLIVFLFFIYTDKFNSPINRIKEKLTIFTV